MGGEKNQLKNIGTPKNNGTPRSPKRRRNNYKTKQKTSVRGREIKGKLPSHLHPKLLFFFQVFKKHTRGRGVGHPPDYLMLLLFPDQLSNSPQTQPSDIGATITNIVHTYGLQN